MLSKPLLFSNPSIYFTFIICITPFYSFNILHLLSKVLLQGLRGATHQFQLVLTGFNQLQLWKARRVHEWAISVLHDRTVGQMEKQKDEEKDESNSVKIKAITMQ
jgi:hypothetical protein